MRILLIPPGAKPGARPRFRWTDRRQPKAKSDSRPKLNAKLKAKLKIRRLRPLDWETQNQPKGLMARLNQRFHDIQEQIERSDSYFARMWRWVWLKLQVWIPNDEPMLRQLRTDPQVVLAHPPDWTGEQAAASWRDYLRRRRLTAAAWLVFYVILGPIATLVSVLPGPNVIGYWFLYRGVCDGLTTWGAHRALQAWPPETAIADRDQKRERERDQDQDQDQAPRSGEGKPETSPNEIA